MRARLISLGLASALVASACTAESRSNEEIDVDNDASAQEDAESTDSDEESNDSGDTDSTPESDESGDDDSGDDDGASNQSDVTQTVDFGEPPPIPDGPLDELTMDAVDTLLGERFINGVFDEGSVLAIQHLGTTEDPRVAWWLSDLLRIAQDPQVSNELMMAATNVMGIEPVPFQPWDYVTSHLMAWDVPPPPEYLTYKQNIYEFIVPAWDPFFDDDADIDWRFLSWGGVGIDDRPFDQTDLPCNCIPAADNPPVTDADGADYLSDDAVVFGVVINGEARAYPRSTMEVREMVNDTLGGRDIGMPYCTLCGSAQVYFTDEVPEGVERPVLRTSGLLIRSNKVMFDVNTFSVFDTFLGTAVSGPLAEQGIVLPQAGVITTTWGQWKDDHPDTTVLAESVANGRPDSDLRNTRDANGPIFPIGEVDDRLPVQEDVIGVTGESGTPIAFQVTKAIEVLEAGGSVEVDGIILELDGGGVRAVDADGNDVGAHQAFWFAWSQFQPDTELWVG